MSNTLLLPSFLFSQVNKKDDGTLFSMEEVLKTNMSATIEAFDSTVDPDRDVIFLCTREKLVDGDYKLCVAGIPVKQYKTDLINLVLSEFKSFPTIVMDDKKDIANVVERVLKNMTFA
jgi:hypothetical protein